MASYAWNIRAGLAASYLAAADWNGGTGPPGPSDAATISAGGIAVTTQELVLGMSARQSGTLSLIGAGTSLTAGGMAVGLFSTGSLSITGGAALLTTGAGGVDSIGYESGGVGAVTIDGAGSTWTSRAAFLNIGYEGSAVLSIRNGGALTMAGYLAIEASPSGTAVATLDGGGSSLAVGNGVMVEGGGGRLGVSNGATLTTGGGIDSVGNFAGAGTASVGGAGALWNQNAQTLVIADPGGTSSLTITQGGTVEIGHMLQVGDTAMSGSIAVQAGGILRVAAVSQNVAFLAALGTAIGSAGSLSVAGAGAQFDTGGNSLLLGSLGSGSLAIGAGGSGVVGVSNDTLPDAAASLCLGMYAGSVGYLTVSGMNARFTANGGGFAGSGGTGHIVVSNGGMLTAGDTAATVGGFGLNIGAGAPAPGTTWIIAGGSADLTVTGGGTVVERNGFSVGLHGSRGSVTIAGGGVLQFAGQLAISNGDSLVGAGNGLVTVGSGGTMTALGPTVASPLVTGHLPALAIGEGRYGPTGAAGTLIVSGVGAVVNTAAYGISVGGTTQADPAGGGGTGFLTVSGGGAVFSGAASPGDAALSIGVAANAAGTVTINDPASLIVASGEVDVGVGGTGALTVESGATLQAAAMQIGVLGGSSGTVTLGAGGIVTVAGTIGVGIGGAGTLSALAGTLASADLAIGAGGLVRLDATAAPNQTITFAAASGTLEIDDLAAFQGVVTGFQSGDTLSVGGISQAGVTITTTPTGTVLDFGTGGTITLAGAYGPGSTGFAALLGLLESVVHHGTVSTISLAAPGRASFALTAAQVMADRDALKALDSPYVLDLSAMTERWTGPTIQGAGLGGSGLQSVQFADGSLTFATTAPAAQIYRLYLSAFGRTPDPAGQHGWTEALDGGASLGTVALGFISSAEFALRYGTTVPDLAFITLLYANVLGRPPDQAGLSTWLAALSNGLSRAQVLVEFSESDEHVASTAAAVQSGLWDLDEAAAEIARLYDTAFGRLPDAAGLQGWVAALDSGALTLAQVAAWFVGSAEFLARYGQTSDSDFVAALYANALHRAPDPSGLANWVAALGNDTTRATVLLGFSESAEHQADTAPNILNADPAQQGILVTGPIQASSAVIGTRLDALEAQILAGMVTGVMLTDPGTAVIPLTLAQVGSDAAALRFISGSFDLDLGSATMAAGGPAILAASLGTTTAANAVTFADGRLVFDTADPAAEIYRLYGAALGRVPDAQGETDWTTALQSGTALTSVSQAFLTSAEFASHYGANLSDGDLVTLLYENVLGRQPDAGGYATWLGSLESGTSRATILVDFSQSAEYIALTAPAIRAGIWDIG